jgi:glycosyltransferase involved in cell wall biosynthesis
MFEMVLLNRSGFIIVNSSVTEDSIRRILKNKTPVRVCRPGCDTFLPLCGATVQEKRRTSGEEVQLLTVGNIIPRKGQLALIRTLLTMVGMSWRLIIVGRDDRETRYSRYLHAVINAGGIGHRVNITGTLSDTEIVKLYRTSDVFIFPSRYEGYGIALAEALSYGLPYAAFNSGGIREICGPVQSGFTLPLNEQRAEKAKSSGQMRDGRSPGAVRCRGGFLVNRDQPETFRIVLERLITDRELRNSLSAEALERFKELPIWEQTGDCFYHALQEAVDLLVT